MNESRAIWLIKFIICGRVWAKMAFWLTVLYFICYAHTQVYTFIMFISSQVTRPRDFVLVTMVTWLVHIRTVLSRHIMEIWNVTPFFTPNFFLNVGNRSRSSIKREENMKMMKYWKKNSLFSIFKKFIQNSKYQSKTIQHTPMTCAHMIPAKFRENTMHCRVNYSAKTTCSLNMTDGRTGGVAICGGR